MSSSSKKDNVNLDYYLRGDLKNNQGNVFKKHMYFLYGIVAAFIIELYRSYTPDTTHRGGKTIAQYDINCTYITASANGKHKYRTHLSVQQLRQTIYCI